MSRRDVAAMTAYTLELREAEVKLNQNESPFDLPRELKEAVLAAALERPWNVYPDFESSMLRGAVARAYGLGPENILVGNGSNELLAAAVATFVGPGTPVIYARPTFSLYEKLVTIAGGISLPVDIDPTTGLLPLDGMLRALDRCDDAVVIVCSPNNPTGGVLPARGIDRLLAAGATVLFDRAYGDFAGDALPPLHDRLVTFSTFSKAWGLAALRVGWLATTAATAREVRKVKLPYSLNVLSESIAAAALEQRALRDANVAAIVAERTRVADAMRPLVETFPSSSNFIAFRPRGDAKALFEELCARGILIRDITHAIPNALRVSIGSRAQNDRFLEALRDATR
ncbi:MAG TPA: aminotransferase class I/II-fold pyridoxal phosphate-dependent enzyme [Thermoanaerobaculia bacterium]|nr:aminotransferase class I/II-fold pyridoxal phosphate-dependent enzyme [Thermoanaerobaculia bacterium]